jgi:hypothetical protein
MGSGMFLEGNSMGVLKEGTAHLKFSIHPRNFVPL